MVVTVHEDFINPPGATTDPGTDPNQEPPVDQGLAANVDQTQDTGQKTTGIGGQPLTAEQASFQNQNPNGGSFPGSTVDQARFNGPGGPGQATPQGPSLGNGAPLTPEQAAFQNTYPNGGSFNNQGVPIGGGGGPTSLPGATPRGGDYMASGPGWAIDAHGRFSSTNSPDFVRANQGFEYGQPGANTLVPGGQGQINSAALGIGGNSNLLGLPSGPGNIPPEGRNFGRGPTMTNEAPGGIYGNFGAYGAGTDARGKPLDTAGLGPQFLQGADPRFSITARQENVTGGGPYPGGPTSLPGLAGGGGTGPPFAGGIYTPPDQRTTPTGLPGTGQSPVGSAAVGSGTGGTGAGGHVIRDAQGNIIGVASANGYYDPRFQSSENIRNNTLQGDPLAYQSNQVLAAAGDPNAKLIDTRIAGLPDYFNSANTAGWAGRHDQQILNRSQNEAGIAGNVAAIQNMGNQRQTINGAPVSNENALMTKSEHTQLMAELVAQGASNPHFTFDGYGNLTIGFTSASGVARTLTNADGTAFSQQDYGRALAQLQASAAPAGGGGGGGYVPRGNGGYAPPAAPAPNVGDYRNTLNQGPNPFGSGPNLFGSGGTPDVMAQPTYRGNVLDPNSPLGRFNPNY